MKTKKVDLLSSNIPRDYIRWKFQYLPLTALLISLCLSNINPRNSLVFQGKWGRIELSQGYRRAGKKENNGHLEISTL